MTREDAISILETMQNNLEETDFLGRCALDMAIEALKAQKHGEWIFDKDYPMLGSPYGSYKCSECGMHTDDDIDYYCWFCGASMRKEGDKNERT